ncbi:heavy metal translocating P-type ATPase [Niabella drilacis]|uniref:Cu+-exporting ATPase n=1 Tax=Niabella drilacis (strain DSM 25811 / CCM 8410 / CCUG 62505 / LMG 26954 / E90) TaxID=1285928 RepID=A0A1G6ZLR5_NIADE|nr:heavy metal translocating P-type ATPase metal-binding domain-containing protein [Niabella drilacis]SDE02506.1 Cu+-exporting ATPase [Niabella drilacis]
MIDLKIACYHCGDPCSDTHLEIGDKHFCCAGCKLVYEVLNEHELCTYYDLNAHPGKSQRHRGREGRFAFLEDEAVISSLVSFTDGKQTHLTLSVPQMHCSSCLWLLEHLDRLQPGILSSRVNFSAKEIFIIMDPGQTTVREVVETLADIGYEPWLSPQGTKRIAEKNNVRAVQISIAGFCFANIMMLSLPEYFSVAGYLQDQIGAAFRYIGLVLALPVFFYCAREFFVNAWKGVKTRTLNIDLSIALAILVTFLRSLYNLLLLDGSTYFDSMSGIVFFMLIGRWAQDKTQRFLVFDRDYRSFFPIAVNLKKGHEITPVLISALKEKDIIEVYDQEIVPADAILVKGKASVDYSFVTGESLPKYIEPGGIIYAGGKQVGERLELMVIKRSDQGYLTHLWNRDAFTEKDGKNSFLYRASNLFTLGVLLLTLAAGLYWFVRGETTLMWNALTTTLIVACPCALLLAATFTNGNVMRILKRSGLFLRNAGVIPAMAAINHVVLDKTGTITLSRDFKITYRGRGLAPDQVALVTSLLRHSTHPLSRAVLQNLGAAPAVAVESFRNVPGMGIEGWVADQHLKIGSRQFVQGDTAPDAEAGSSRVFISTDGMVLGFFELQNTYREGLADFMERIQEKTALSILSGDNSAEYPRLREMTGPGAVIRFDQSPEDKYRYIKTLQDHQQHVLVAGDGLNDAGALRQSNVGIAVMDRGGHFTPASDAIIRGNVLTRLDQMLEFAGKAAVIIKVSFVYSIIYNLIGLYFALQGMLRPVVAAILMPVSSIGIILITFFLSEWYGRKLRSGRA